MNLKILSDLERKILWLASWTIHNANHLRPNDDGIKVGGHQASSASLATIMTALYFHVLRPQDRVAVKPHASPIFHAIQYLFGLQTREKLDAFRGYKGVQSYPSRTKDIDDVDFSTGSVGLGVAQTLFSSLVQDYVRSHGWLKEPDGRMIALIGDAEMDEGNIYEALIEGWKHGLRNVWWIIDYNRQSLDACTHDGLLSPLQHVFTQFGWDVVILKYGARLQAAAKEPGGDKLIAWIDACPNQLYSALVFQGGAAWRKRLLDDIGDQGAVSRLIDSRSDDELQALMTNLAGHDMSTLLDAFGAIDHDRPVCFFAYTIKGFGLPLAGHKDNHSGLMTPAQLDTFRAGMNVRPGHEWDKFEGMATPAPELERFLADVPFTRNGRRRYMAPAIPVPDAITVPVKSAMSTQQGFGLLLNELGRQSNEFAARLVTTAPDVTVSTNLGAWVNRRGLFAHSDRGDTFKAEKIPSTYNWTAAPTGQHLELGIAESNLFIALSAFGLSYSIHNERLFPIGTLYDPFISRGLDAMNYACYQDARFILAATPSGITLASEGGAHQSIGTPLIGMAQPGLSAFEPAFIDELSALMSWSFEHLQRHGDNTPDPRNCLADGAGGSVYFRLSTRPMEQPVRTLTPAQKQDIADGAYWFRPPGPNCTVIVAYAGVMAPEAISAVGLMGEEMRDIGLLAVTSPDRLHAGWTGAQRARESGNAAARAHIERLFSILPRDAGIVSVVDAHPATLGWLGAVRGNRSHALGVEQFGQTGALEDLYRHYRIDTHSIIAAARALVRARLLND